MKFQYSHAQLRLKHLCLLFWRFISTNLTQTIKNKYQQAIKNKETVAFLLGKGTYLHQNYDAERGRHTPYKTFYNILAYAQQNGEKKMMRQFETDIQTVLRTELTAKEFLYVVTYIFLYQLSTIEQELFLPWIMNDQTKILFKQRWEIVQAEYASDEFNLDQISQNIKNIKERYGVSLLG